MKRTRLLWNTSKRVRPDDDFNYEIEIGGGRTRRQPRFGRLRGRGGDDERGEMIIRGRERKVKAFDFDFLGLRRKMR